MDRLAGRTRCRSQRRRAATGMRFLSLHGYTDIQLSKLRRMLRFCGALTLALNTSGALGHQMFGRALVDAVGPALLIGWSEIGPGMLRQIYAVGSMTAAAQQGPRSATRLARTLSTDELARARKLDDAHRAGTGRPISRDILRDQMRIGRDNRGHTHGGGHRRGRVETTTSGVANRSSDRICARAGSHYGRKLQSAYHANHENASDATVC